MTQDHSQVPKLAASIVGADDEEVRPFQVSIPEEALVELIYFNSVDKGGHFAAWKQPKLFAAELRAAFRSLRPRALGAR